MNKKEILQHVIKTTIKAGKIIMSFYNNNDYYINYKGEKKDDNPVTQADIESNKIIINELKKYNYGILSEESIDDQSRLKEERVWIIDPMDGTKDFIKKTGDFTVMIGLVEKREAKYVPILGVIYIPASETLYFAIEKEGAFIQHKDKKKEKIKVSNINNIYKSRNIRSRFHESDFDIKLCKEFNMKTIEHGSSLKVGLISQGDAELTLNQSDKTWEWDICASDIILSEAGGKITDINNKNFSYNKKDPRNLQGYLATNGLIHNEILKILKQ